MSQVLPNLYTVDLTGDCPSRLPCGCRYIGLLHLEGVGSGALVQIVNSGLYVLVVDGSIHYLNQVDVAKVLKGPTPLEDIQEFESQMGFAKSESLFGDIGID